MEKIIKKTCTALFASAALFACTREVGPEVPEAPQGPETITITINASNDTESRTAIGENGASLWTPGDKLAVIQFFHTDQRYHFETSFSGYAESQPLESEGPVPVHQFSVTFPNYMYTFGEEESEWITYDHLADIEGHPGKKFLYQAFYPSETIDSYDYSCPVLHVPSRQRPLADSFDPLADILYSKPVYLESQPSTMDLSFKRFSALGIMTLSGIPDGISENAVVSSVEFISGITGHENDSGPLQAPRTRANLYNCPPLTGDVYQEDHIFYPENGNYVHDYIDLEYVITLDYTGKELKAKGLKAYFTCWPTKFEEETCFTVKVTVDDNGQTKTYSRTVFLNGRELEFSSGVATTFSVDMTQAVLMKEPTINDFVTFDERTLAYFPELGSDNPEIRIPFSNVFNELAFGGIPISFTPNDGVSLEGCYIDDQDNELEGFLWLQYYGDEGPEGGYLRYNSSVRNPDNPLSTSLVFELEVNGTIRSFRVPVSEYEYGFTVPSVTLFLGESADDWVEVDPDVDPELFVGRSVTLHAVIDSKPGDLTPLACYWTNDKDYDWNLDGDFPVPVHSGEWTILSLEASSDQRSVVVTGIDEGFDYANFIMIFDDIWFPDSWIWVNFDVAPLAPPFYGDNDAAGGDMGGGKVINL